MSITTAHGRTRHPQAVGDDTPGFSKLLADGHALIDIQRMLDAGTVPAKDRIPNFVPYIGAAVHYGQSGSFKTFLELSAAITIAGGLDWAGQAVEPAGVLYIPAEDYRNVLFRALAVARHRDVAIEDIPLKIIPMRGTVHDPHFASEVIEAAKLFQNTTGIKLGAVFLDTLGASFGKQSQDDAGPMSNACNSILEIAETMECAVSVVHHMGKSGEAMRGSQVLFDRADLVVKLKKPTKVGQPAECLVEKARNGITGEKFSFGVEPFTLRGSGSEVFETLVATAIADGATPQASPSPARKKLPGDTQTALDVLMELVPFDETVNAELWRERTYTAFGNRSQSALRNAFHGARKLLRSEGLISDDGSSVSVSAA